jgi:autotransporter translocation and assembly factor TamB
VKTFSSPSMSENDRISYLVAGKPAREGASLSLEREIAKDLSVGVRVDTKTGESAFITRYRILRTLYAEVGSSARSSSLDLFYTLETD